MNCHAWSFKKMENITCIRGEKVKKISGSTAEPSDHVCL